MDGVPQVNCLSVPQQKHCHSVCESPDIMVKVPQLKYDFVKDRVEGGDQDLERLPSEPGCHVLFSTAYIYISSCWMLSLKVTKY